MRERRVHPRAGRTIPKDIYTVEAHRRRRAGSCIAATFSPKTVEREYLEKFPGWSRVDVTTGWLRGDGRRAVRSSTCASPPIRSGSGITTRRKVLPRIYDHVMKVTDNRPLPDKQPFHRDLDVEVWMSEPDFRIGVDEELISSLESLHEDLYFVTLDFFDALGPDDARAGVWRRRARSSRSFIRIAPASRAQVADSTTPATRRRSRSSRSCYKEKGCRAADARDRAISTKIDTTAAVVNPRRGAGGSASASSSSTSKPRTTARRRARSTRSTRSCRLQAAGALPRPRCRSTTSIGWRSRSA